MSRILPTGLITIINQAGVDYYKNLIKALKSINVEPFLTLYHQNLPQKLQDAGGWPNPKLEEHFAEYARMAFKLFGDDVKLWGTFNEPAQACYAGYDYLCIHTIIKSHARAYHIYDKEFRRKQQGKITFVVDAQWFVPVLTTTS